MHTAAAIDSDGRLPVFAFGSKVNDGKAFALNQAKGGLGVDPLKGAEIEDLATSMRMISEGYQTIEPLGRAPNLSFLTHMITFSQMSINPDSFLFFLIYLSAVPPDADVFY